MVYISIYILSDFNFSDRVLKVFTATKSTNLAVLRCGIRGSIILVLYDIAFLRSSIFRLGRTHVLLCICISCVILIIFNRVSCFFKLRY